MFGIKRKYKIDNSKAINIFWLEVFYFQDMLKNQPDAISKLRSEIIRYREYEVREMLEFHLKKRQTSNDDDLKKNIVNIIQNLESSNDEYFEFRYLNKV